MEKERRARRTGRWYRIGSVSRPRRRRPTAATPLTKVRSRSRRSETAVEVRRRKSGPHGRAEFAARAGIALPRRSIGVTWVAAVAPLPRSGPPRANADSDWCCAWYATKRSRFRSRRCARTGDACSRARDTRRARADGRGTLPRRERHGRAVGGIRAGGIARCGKISILYMPTLLRTKCRRRRRDHRAYDDDSRNQSSGRLHGSS